MNISKNIKSFLEKNKNLIKIFDNLYKDNFNITYSEIVKEVFEYMLQTGQNLEYKKGKIVSTNLPIDKIDENILKLKEDIKFNIDCLLAFMYIIAIKYKYNIHFKNFKEIYFEFLHSFIFFYADLKDGGITDEIFDYSFRYIIDFNNVPDKVKEIDLRIFCPYLDDKSKYVDKLFETFIKIVEKFNEKIYFEILGCDAIEKHFCDLKGKYKIKFIEEMIKFAYKNNQKYLLYVLSAVLNKFSEDVKKLIIDTILEKIKKDGDITIYDYCIDNKKIKVKILKNIIKNICNNKKYMKYWEIIYNLAKKYKISVDGYQCQSSLVIFDIFSL